MPDYLLLKRDAQRAYERQDYERALAILDKIVASTPSQAELVATLDLRVSVYLKLGNNVAARNDATQMIRTNRSDGRGYLRRGQLERLTNDHAAALKWYEHGLKQVPQSDRLHAYINAQHAKTTAVLKAHIIVSKPVDPFTKLPAEMVEMVLRFFNYRQVVILLRVSKTWRHMLHTYSTLRNTLDFSQVGTGKLVTLPGIKAALRRSQNTERPVLVIARNLTQPAARHFRETMERPIHYVKMQHFEVNYPSNGGHYTWNVSFESLPWQRFQLRTLVFGPDHMISTATIFKILQICETLEKATFSSVRRGPDNLEVHSWARSTATSRPNLTSLTIQGPKEAAPSLLLAIPVRPCLHTFLLMLLTLAQAKFFERFGELRHLVLKNMWLVPDAPGSSVTFDFSCLKSLQSFECSTLRVDQWPKLPASLELLDCTECRAEYSRPFPTGQDTFANLRIARLARSPVGHVVLCSILRSASDKLTYLDVDLRADRAGDASWTLFLDAVRGGSLKGLTFLRIWYSMLSDEHIDTLVEHCRKLETVDLSSPNVTGVCVVRLLTAPDNRVKRLVLRDCTKISADTYEWARQKAVIERTSTEAYGGSGRRVHALS